MKVFAKSIKLSILYFAVSCLWLLLEYQMTHFDPILLESSK